MKDKNKIYVLGVGPGNSDYIAPIIHKKVEQCDVLVGSNRALEIFRPLGKKEVLINADIESTIQRITELRKMNRLGVLVSGDPGFYSFLNTLLRYFPREDLEVYPGISSLQYLFAAGVLPWHDAYITSLHGRRLKDLTELVKAHEKVAFLTDTKFPVGEIARYLVEQGVRQKRVLVGEDLSYPSERIRDLFLEEWVGQKVEPLCVMVIYPNS